MRHSKNLYFESNNRKNKKRTDLKILNVGSNNPSLDAVDLDHKMPKKEGMDVAKEILAVNPYQRIIFASAHTMEFLGDIV
jgi:response regulator RpfG family c-di-GMP phosphodiesterase